MINSKIIVTGGLGFIGTNLILNLIKSKYKVLNLDKNSESSNKKLINFNHKNYFFHKIDLSKSNNQYHLLKIVEKFKPKIIINLASESHVDKSIDIPQKVYISNVNATLNLLIAINRSTLKRKIKLIHIGTDEVYGDLNINSKKKFSEDSKYITSNPYSASKASQINLVQAFMKTYNVNAIIINPCNNYGPYQYPEKLIPKSLNLIMSNKAVELYGNGKQVRDWIFVEDTVKGIKCVMNKGKIGHLYNLSANYTISNNSLIKKMFLIINSLVKNKYNTNIVYVKDRPGHDLKYASSNKRILKLGWKPIDTLNTGLRKTVLFYLTKNNFFKDNKVHLKRFGIK